jgi:FkbM family methyltransferase
LGSRLVGNDGRIYAFEPSQATFDALNKNIELNKINNVFPQRLALSNTEGFIHLGAVENDALNYIDVNNKNTQGEKVVMTTLDKWLKDNKLRKIDFIKIDIEGAELLCFEGAQDMLENTPPTIIMECNEKWCGRFNYSVFDLLKFLHSFGYTFEQYEEAQWICYPPKK